MIKSYKIRLHPTLEQEQAMWRHIGACRWIWNYMLELQMQRYRDRERHLSDFDMIKLLKPLKNDGEHEWLYEVSADSTRVICQDLDKAYKRFFSIRPAHFSQKTKERAARRGRELTSYELEGHPKFKSRKNSKPNFPLRQSAGAVYFADGIATIPKIGKVRYSTNYTLPQGNKAKFSNPRISYVGGKWMLTLGVECESQVFELSDKPMGIDLGLKELAVVAIGDESAVFHNINKSRCVRMLESKRKYMQHEVARKYRTNGSYDKTASILKYEGMIAEIDRRLSNIRRNYIHQTTHELVSLLPYAVVMEDLDVKGMGKDRHRRKAVRDQCLGEFIRQMKYKCEWNGISFQQVGRYYPSSKTCSGCGFVKKDLKESDRVYECPDCGLVIDRDYNAALNLMRCAEPPERSVA